MMLRAHQIRALATLLAVSVLALSTVAPRAARADDVEAAREAYSRGQELFDEGEYLKARQAFVESLEAFRHFKTVFNIALCDEKLGRIPEAIAMYEEYVEWPAEVPNRDEVHAKIEELTALLPEQPDPEGPAEAEPAPDPDGEDTADDPGDTADPARPTDGPDLRVPGWISLSVGAAGLVAGGVMLGLAQSKAKQIQGLTEYDPAKHEDLPDEGRALELGGWIAGGVGLAAVATGIALLVAGGGDDEGEGPVQATLVPTRGGVGAGARWRF